MLSEGKAITRLDREVALLRTALMRARPFVVHAADDKSHAVAQARDVLKLVDEALAAAAGA